MASKERRATDFAAATTPQPGARSATEGKGHLHKPGGKARCAAGIGRSDRRDPLGKDALPTGHVVTEESADSRRSRTATPLQGSQREG